MQPGKGYDRKRPNLNDSSDQGSRRRRRSIGAASLPEQSNDGDQQERRIGGDAVQGLTREASVAAELERQLREQILFNELLQSRRHDPRLSLGGLESLGVATRHLPMPMFDPSHNFGLATPYEPMFDPSSQTFRQPHYMDRIQQDHQTARHASSMISGLELARPEQVGLPDGRHQLTDPLFPAESLDRLQLMLQQSLRQRQLPREHPRPNLHAPLTDLERFSRGLGDYAMAHHHRFRDLSAPPRVTGIHQQPSEESSLQRFRPFNDDMRSTHRLGPIGGDSLARVDQRSADTRTSGLPMALSSDAEQLTIYQVLIRRSLEYFVAKESDVATSVRGRKQKIRIGQIGVRCRYCAHLPLRQRSKGAVYYAKSLVNVYQAAQNIATAHFTTTSACPYLPAAIREEIAIQRPRRDASKAGRSYWVEACHNIGIIERDDALWFDIGTGGKADGKSETL